MLRIGLTLAVLVVILDQILKAVMLDMLPEPGIAITVTSFFNLVHVFNPGVSFGLLPDIGPIVLSAFALVVSAILGVWLARAETRLMAVALGLTIGGAIGNVIDRLRFGAVFDFLDFHVIGWHWPAFNLADAAISIGVAGLLLTSLFSAPRETKVDES